MIIYDLKGNPMYEAELSKKHLGSVCVYGDKIAIEYSSKTVNGLLKDIIKEVLSSVSKRFESEDVSLLIAPSIQRKRFGLMLYLHVAGIDSMFIVKIRIDSTHEERISVMDAILSQKEMISETLYSFYNTQYGYWKH